MKSPLSIHIRFRIGRTHLHPWHAAPNEGRVEWPPSPWRLLRALVAVAGRGLTTLPEAAQTGTLSDDWFVAATTGKTGKRKREITDSDSYWNQHIDSLPFRTLAGLLWQLATPPTVWLPRTSIGHTRHFFPTKSGSANGWVEHTGSAVFDTFAAIDPQQTLVFEWEEMSLPDSDNEHLKTLLSGLLYFGRSESLCDVVLKTERFEAGETHWPCVAVEEKQTFRRYFEGRREYRDYTVEKRLGWDADQLGFLRQQLGARGADEPELLLRALLQPSGESMKHGDRPWGTRWLHYAVPNGAFRLPVRRPSNPVGHSQEHLRPQAKLQILRYAINTATISCAVLPPITATLAIAERCRSAAMAVFGRQNGGLCSPQLSGKRRCDHSRRYELFADTYDNQVTKFDNKNGSHSAHAYV